MRIIALENLQQFAAVNLLADPGHIAGPKIIPNAAMVRLNWQLPDGKTGHNVLYAAYTGTPALSTAIADNIFAAIKGQFTSSLLATYIASTVSLQSVTLLDVRSTTGVEINSTTAAAPGTSASPALPDEVAVVVTIRSNTRGPGGRGRFYVPGWAGNAAGASGVVLAGAVTALQTWSVSGVFTAINGQLGTPGLGLPKRAGYTSPLTGRVFPQRDAILLTPVTYIVRNNTWDSQRRRGLK